MANAAGRAARERLIVTAERLFAQRGIDAVPLREIGEEAGQRNVAAANYYFGDRDGLVRAIFEYRLAQVNARHRELLEATLATTDAGEPARVRGLLEALVRPLWEQREVGHFLGFIARLQTDFGRGDQYIADDSIVATGEIVALCRDEFPMLTDAVFQDRMVAVQVLAVHLLATRQQVGPLSGVVDDEEWLDDLVAIQTGMLAAPSTAVASRASRRKRR
jgi:AcrR family transcriptional regulator